MSDSTLSSTFEFQSSKTLANFCQTLDEAMANPNFGPYTVWDFFMQRETAQSLRETGKLHRALSISGALKKSLHTDDRTIDTFLQEAFNVRLVQGLHSEYTSPGENLIDQEDYAELYLKTKGIFLGENRLIVYRRNLNEWSSDDHTSDRLTFFVWDQDPERIIDVLRQTYLEPPPRDLEDTREKGSLHLLLETPNGFQFVPAGIAGWPLETANYPEEIQTAFQRAVKNLTDENPHGRVTILSGEPGTGKTYFIRGLMEECSNCLFVIVNPEMVPALGRPNMVKTFLDHKNNNPNGNLVIIIEDADQCLVARQSDNISAISALLNLGEGLLGEILNVRIVASTNYHKLKIDEALKRPGRLNQLVTFDYLTADHAMRIYHRLTGRDDLSIISVVPNQRTNDFGFSTRATEATPRLTSLSKVYEAAQPHLLEQETQEKTADDLRNINTIRAKLQLLWDRDKLQHETQRDKVRRQRRTKASTK